MSTVAGSNETLIDSGCETKCSKLRTGRCNRSKGMRSLRFDPVGSVFRFLRFRSICIGQFFRKNLGFIFSSLQVLTVDIRPHHTHTHTRIHTACAHQFVCVQIQICARCSSLCDIFLKNFRCVLYFAGGSLLCFCVSVDCCLFLARWSCSLMVLYAQGV